MITPDWNLLRAFSATAEAGSLSAAARKLDLTQPTLSRQIAALEAALGVTLFERIGRRLVITAVGGWGCSTMPAPWRRRPSPWRLRLPVSRRTCREA